MGPMSRREAEALIRQGLVPNGVIVETDAPDPKPAPETLSDKAGADSQPSLPQAEPPFKKEPCPANLPPLPVPAPAAHAAQEENDEEQEHRDGCWMTFLKALLVGGVIVFVKHWLKG